MLIIYHQIVFWIIIILESFLLIFFISTIITLSKNKRKVTLYLALNYLSFIVAIFLFGMSHLDAISQGFTTDFYYQGSMLANIFVMLGIISNIAFHSQFSEASKTKNILKYLFGFLVIGWILLPFNYVVEISSGFQLKYVTYIFMSLYGIIIYTGLTISFFKMSYFAKNSKKQLIYLGLGSLIFLVYFVIIVIFGVTQAFILLIVSMICLLASFLCYFIGIYLPKFRISK